MLDLSLHLQSNRPHSLWTAGAKVSARTNRELKILQDQQAVAKLVMQYRVERAAKRMGIVGAKDVIGEWIPQTEPGLYPGNASSSPS